MSLGARHLHNGAGSTHKWSDGKQALPKATQIIPCFQGLASRSSEGLSRCSKTFRGLSKAAICGLRRGSTGPYKSTKGLPMSYAVFQELTMSSNVFQDLPMPSKVAQLGRPMAPMVWENQGPPRPLKPFQGLPHTKVCGVYWATTSPTSAPSCQGHPKSSWTFPSLPRPSKGFPKLSKGFQGLLRSSTKAKEDAWKSLPRPW